MIEWKNIPESYDEYVGFVYLIYEKDTAMKYIGITRYWEKIKKKPGKYKTKNGKYLKDKKGKRILETRTTRKHFKKETDWRNYNSSAGKGFLAERIINNPNNYKKTILRNCKSLSELKGYEAFMILKAYFVDDWKKYYNQLVQLKITLSKGDR